MHISQLDPCLITHTAAIHFNSYCIGKLNYLFVEPDFFFSSRGVEDWEEKLTSSDNRWQEDNFDRWLLYSFSPCSSLIAALTLCRGILVLRFLSRMDVLKRKMYLLLGKKKRNTSRIEASLSEGRIGFRLARVIVFHLEGKMWAWKQATRLRRLLTRNDWLPFVMKTMVH